MIIPVKKANLFVLNDQKEHVLSIIQKNASFMLDEKHHLNKYDLTFVQKINQAIEILENRLEKSSTANVISITSEKFDNMDVNLDQMVVKILDLENEILSENKQIEKINQKIAELRPYQQLKVSVADTKKIKIADVFYVSVDQKNKDRFLSAIQQFGIEYTEQDDYNKRSYFVVADVKEKSIIKSIRFAGLDLEISKGLDLFEREEEVNAKIQQFEADKLLATDILNRFSLKKKLKKTTTLSDINEEIIYRIIDNQKEIEKLEANIFAVKDEMLAYQPFRTLNVTAKSLKDAVYTETIFGKLKTKFNKDIILKDYLYETNVYQETKTHQYMSLTFQKHDKESILKALGSAFEMIHLDSGIQTFGEAYETLEQNLEQLENQVIANEKTLETYLPYLLAIRHCPSFYLDVKKHLIDLRNEISKDPVFSLFKFNLLELLQLRYVTLKALDIDDKLITIDVRLNQSELRQLIFSEYQVIIDDIPHYAQRPELIIKGFENEILKHKNKINELETEIDSYKDATTDLKVYYDQVTNDKKRDSIDYTKTVHTSYLGGWVLADQIDALKSSLDDADILYEMDIIDPEEGEIIPTAFKNNALVAPFESITNMFSPPASDEVDPNPVMSFWYWIIFGMMMGDIGYGVVLLIACASFLYFKKPKGTFKSMLTVFGLSGISTIFAGILYGSVFGYPIGILPPEFTIDLINQPLVMLTLCVSIGGLHIICGLILKVINLVRAGDILSALAEGVSWILILSGIPLWLIFPDMSYIGLGTIGVGVMLVLLFSGHSQKNIISKALSGVISLYNATAFMGDILSYSRILALALSGAVIASTMNLLAEMVLGAGIIGFVFAALIYLVGHLFNFGMNLLSAYVHTGRLQYLEFFGKFYTGGGILYAPLQLELKYIYSIENKF